MDLVAENSKPTTGSWPGLEALGAFYRDRPVLVTGANGFLGLNMVYALQALGARLSILVLEPRSRAAHYAGRTFQGNLRDRALVEEAIRGQSVVFDFAGVSGAVPSNLDPAGYLDRECGPHLQLIKACAEAPDSPVVVFCSSRLVYGKPCRLPVDEDHPLNPTSMYAVHKITIEHYLNVFAHTDGLRYCVLRLSNPYGPHQPPETRSYGIINRFLRLAAHGRTIHVFGDGRQRRDYIFTEDVMRTFLLAAMTERCHGEIFNLGGRQSVSIVEAVQTIARLAGGTPVQFDPWPEDYEKVETGDYQSDLRKIDAYLDLPPATALEDGLHKTLAFYRREENPVSG